jgi:hypothetical protein
LEEVGAQLTPGATEKTDTGTKRNDTTQQDAERSQNREEVTTFEIIEEPVIITTKKEIGGDVATPMPMPFVPTIF